MRTLQVVNVRWYNATAWYGVTLARELGKAGHPSLVLGLADTPPLEQARRLGLETRALPLNSLNPFSLSGLWRDLDALARDFRPDVVNCHRGEAFVLWALLKRRHHFALVRTRGDRRLPRGGFVNRWLHAGAADAVIATNSGMAGHFRDRMGIPPGRVHTIPGGVDTGRFRPDGGIRRAVRDRLGFAGDAVVLGLVGRMDEVKGIRETIQALGQVARSGFPGADRLRFLLIGFPSRHNEEDIARWTAEQGLGRLGDKVLVTGRVERPEDYIRALDMGILPSLGSEAIARAALEIMACGVPLAASRVGVMPDILPAEYLFPPGDILAMAAILRQSLNRDWRAALQTLCFERIMAPSGFRLDVFREQTLAVYRAALEQTQRKL